MFRMKFLSAAMFAVLACPLVAVAQQPAPAPAPKVQPVKPVEVTSATWKQEVEQSKLPVFVDFYAPWCGPCQATAPHVEKAAEDWKGKVKVAKVNTDNEPGLAAQNGARRIPTLIIFYKGKAIAIQIGGHTSAQIDQMIGDALKTIAKNP